MLSRSKTIALTGTCFIHLLVAVFLLLCGLERSMPAKEEEGLFVNFGTVDEASGLFEPETQTAAETVTKATAETVSEDLITQDMEASIALTEKKKEAETKKELEAEQQRKASEIRNQTASVFAKSPGQTSNQGTAATGTGNQGSISGSPSSTTMIGGGQGYGNFSLDGRSTIGSLPRPPYTIQEEGVVVVKIVVNPKGSVVSAAINLQGTTTDNATLRSAALSAARQARFNDITGTQNQSGTITYHFKLK